MCDPVVIAGVGAGVTAIAAGVETGVSIDAAQKEAAFEEDQAKTNAELAQAQSDETLNIGGWEASRIEAEGRRVEALAQNQILASGSSEGSNVNLLVASKKAALGDAQRVRAAAASRAWGFGEEAEAYLKRGRWAREAGILGSVSAGAAGTQKIVGTGLSFAGKL